MGGLSFLKRCAPCSRKTRASSKIPDPVRLNGKYTISYPIPIPEPSTSAASDLDRTVRGPRAAQGRVRDQPKKARDAPALPTLPRTYFRPPRPDRRSPPAPAPPCEKCRRNLERCVQCFKRSRTSDPCDECRLGSPCRTGGLENAHLEALRRLECRDGVTRDQELRVIDEECDSVWFCEVTSMQVVVATGRARIVDVRATRRP